MWKQLQVTFYFIQSINICMCEWLQVIFLFLECNRSYVRTIASHIGLDFDFRHSIVRTYEWLQLMSYIFICGVQSFVCAHNCKSYWLVWILISGMQSFARTNDCKSYIFWFWFYFLVCNCSYVRTIASHIIIDWFVFCFPVCNCLHIQTIASLILFYFQECSCLHLWTITGWKVWGHGQMVMVWCTTQKHSSNCNTFKLSNSMW